MRWLRCCGRGDCAGGERAEDLQIRETGFSTGDRGEDEFARCARKGCLTGAIRFAHCSRCAAPYDRRVRWGVIGAVCGRFWLSLPGFARKVQFAALIGTLLH